MNFGMTFGLLGGASHIPPAGYIIEPPSDLAGTGNDEGGGVFNATLTWTDPVGNDNPTVKYYIYKEGVKIATVPSGTFTYKDTDVLPDTAYVYSISLKDTEGYVSANGLDVAVAIPDLVLASKPSTPSVDPRGVDSRNLVWTASTDGSYTIKEYSIRQDGKLVGTTSALTLPVYFQSRDRNTIVWTVQAVDTAGWKSSESNEGGDLGDGNIDPITNAIEWTKFDGIADVSTKVLLGALLQNETLSNQDNSIFYGGVDNELQDEYEDVEFSFRNEYDGADMHSFSMTLRHTDIDNYIGFRVFGGSSQIYEKIAGVFSKKMDIADANVIDQDFKIKSVGNVISIYKGSGKIFEYTTTITDGRIGLVQRQSPLGDLYFGGYYKAVVTSPAILVTKQPGITWYGFSSVNEPNPNNTFGSITNRNVSVGTLTQFYVGSGEQCKLRFAEGDVGTTVTATMGGMSGIFTYVVDGDDYELLDGTFSAMVRDSETKLMSVAIV